MVAGAAGLAGVAEGAAEAEMGVVVDRVGLDDRLELGRGAGVVAGAVAGAAERLAQRGLLRFPPRRLFQRLGGVLEIAVLEQLEAAAVERVGGLGSDADIVRNV